MTDKVFTLHFPKGQTLDLEGPSLKAVLFMGRMRLAYVQLPNQDLQQIQLPDANLEGANLRGADLRFANLRGANLKDADLRDCQLGLADLTGANLTRAACYGAKMRGADLSNAIIHGTDMRKVDLTNAKMDEAFVRSARLPKQRRGERVCTVDITHDEARFKYLLFRLDNGDKILWTAALGDDVPLELEDFAAALVARLNGAQLAEAIDVIAFFQARIKTLSEPVV